MKSLLQFAAFQAFWLAAVLGAARGLVWLGPIALVPYLGWMVWGERGRVRLALRWIAAGTLGSLLDCALAAHGLVHYPTAPSSWPAALVPPFIASLWIAFATLPHVSLSWLARRPALAAALGALGGPLSFAAGVRAGAVHYGDSALATNAALALEYAVATPLLLGWLSPRPVDACIQRRGRRVGGGVTALRVLVVAVIGLAGFALLPACFSMKKATVERRLLALEKNAPLRGQIRTLERRVTIGGEEVEASFRFYRAGVTGLDRPVVVLVHGTPSSLVTWTASVFGPDGLEQDCDVLALEMVGHGTTRTELGHYTFERGAEWIQAFLDALDLSGVTLVGNSYGGEFVWRAALNRPERIARIVLMSSSGFPRRDDEWLPEEVKMRGMSLAKIGWMINSRERVRAALAPHFQTPVPDEHVEEVALVCSNRDNWHAMIDLARDENGTRGPELATLAQPALLLWGAQDVAYRPERFGALFQDTIPKARLQLVENAGHYPQEEQPGVVARSIARFARGE